MRRPLIAVALLYSAGVLISDVPVPLTALFPVAIGIAIVCLAVPRVRLISLCVLIVLSGWINMAQRTRVISPRDLRILLGGEQENAGVRGELCETPVVHIHHNKEKNIDTFTTTAQVDVTEVLLPNRGEAVWQPAYGRITVTAKGRLPADFFGGQTVQIGGALQPVPGPLAEGLFDYQKFLANQGIYHQLRVEKLSDWQILKSPAVRPLADRFRDWAKRTLASGLPTEDLPLYLEWALTLGWKPALTEEVSEPFIQAATLIVCVS